MSTQIQINRGVQNGAEIRFFVENHQVLELIKPAGKMITDSERKSFVYLIDEEDGYGHIHFPQSVWPLMVETLNAEIDPILSYETKHIQLTNFIEELMMLIFNIEGNNNYGEDFTTVVEETFAEILETAR